MVEISAREIILETGGGNIPPRSPLIEIPHDEAPIPKRSGHKRIIQRLQRMSSSPALAKLGRSKSGDYRSNGKGSMSCASLASSPSMYGHSYGNSHSSQMSGYSTAPTSGSSTPGLDAQFFDSMARVRLVGQGIGTLGNTIPLPADVRSGSKGMLVMKNWEGGDYFTRPISKPKPKKKRLFDFWKDMPDEIKVHIFQYLKPKEIVQCSGVSKAWHRMCFDGQLWKTLDFTEFYKDIPAEALVKIITHAGPFVRELNMRGCIQLKDFWGREASTLSDLCRNLEYFNVEGSRIDRASMHSFFLRNRNLVWVNLAALSAANNSAMKILASKCSKLEYLDVSFCCNIDAKGLKRVVECCPLLSELRAGGVKELDNEELMLELFKQNSLERLVLINTDVTDQSLSVLMQGQNPDMDPLTDLPIVPPRRLKHLDLSGCTDLTDRGIETLAHNCPNMEGLQLSFIKGITEDTLGHVVTTCPNLTHLDLEEFDELTNAFLQTLARSPCAPHLSHLNISYCENLGDLGMLAVLKASPNLHTLYMDNTRISDLVLAEASSQVAKRNKGRPHTGAPIIGMRMVCYDCQNVTWAGVREVLARNSETHHPFTDVNTSSPESFPAEIISLKCFFGWMQTVEEHTNRVLRGELMAASRLDRKWAAYMMANEEVGAGGGGAGARRRRRRLREAALLHAEEEGDDGGPGGGRRRRARSGGCTVM
ncbi:MAG: hypothetical protein M1834_000887 [Cirrosporium novae-zelandiae]|nr:MAG: hypothetical protein M1834_000887 [Cirrosporium novae-zelandiae]